MSSKMVSKNSLSILYPISIQIVTIEVDLRIQSRAQEHYYLTICSAISNFNSIENK